MPALASQPQVTQQRYIIVKGDQGIAIRTFRAGVDNRLGGRKPVNADIQKTPDTKSHQESENFIQIWYHALSFAIVPM